MKKKVCIIKAMVFPVVLYGCDSWMVSKAEHQRIDDFKFWCWRRLLGVPWASRRSNQSILKEINPECTWKDWCWSCNTLATWCKEPTHWNLMLEKIEGKRRREQQIASLMLWIDQRGWAQPGTKQEREGGESWPLGEPGSRAEPPGQAIHKWFTAVAPRSGIMKPQPTAVLFVVSETSLNWAFFPRSLKE